MTNDQQPSQLPGDPFALNPTDQVQRQQLNILQYWAERNLAPADDDIALNVTAPAPTSLPDRWSLLRGLALRTW